MRPTLLDRLFAPVTVLPGIGPQLGRLFERAAGPLVVDLLWHLPVGVVDRRAAPPIGALNPRDWPDAIVTVPGRAGARRSPRCTRRRATQTSSRRPRSANVSPMTRSWRRSLPWRWCAPAGAAAPAGYSPARASCRRPPRPDSGLP